VLVENAQNEITHFQKSFLTVLCQNRSDDRFQHVARKNYTMPIDCGLTVWANYVHIFKILSSKTINQTACLFFQNFL
jgi:hypothetical protein